MTNQALFQASVSEEGKLVRWRRVEQLRLCLHAVHRMQCFHAEGPVMTAHYLYKGRLPIGAHAFVCDLAQGAAALIAPTACSPPITQGLRCLLCSSLTIKPDKQPTSSHQRHCHSKQQREVTTTCPADKSVPSFVHSTNHSFFAGVHS